MQMIIVFGATNGMLYLISKTLQHRTCEVILGIVIGQATYKHPVYNLKYCCSSKVYAKNIHLKYSCVMYLLFTGVTAI